MRGPRRPEPVLTVHLYPELLMHLLAVLTGLSAAGWQHPTGCPGWSVRDVALHLLGGDLGLLSRPRDGQAPLVPRDGEALGPFLTRINDDWVTATRRLSPPVIVELLRGTGEQVSAYLASLDPLAIGERVDWAGPRRAPNWLNVAREYTERWVHQTQIREALDAPPLDDVRLFGSVLATFVYALPRTYAAIDAPVGTAVALTIEGAGGGTWMVARGASDEDGNGGWELFAGSPDARPAATGRTDADTAWRLFTKGLTPGEATRRVSLEASRRWRGTC